MHLYSIALQPDGKIVIAGTGGDDENSNHFLTGRFNADGSPDLGFGSAGFGVDAFSTTDVAFNVTLQDDGKIVVSGREDYPSTAPAVVARYTSSGQIDSDFGDQGKLKSRR